MNNYDDDDDANGTTTTNNNELSNRELNFSLEALGLSFLLLIVLAVTIVNVLNDRDTVMKDRDELKVLLTASIHSQERLASSVLDLIDKNRSTSCKSDPTIEQRFTSYLCDLSDSIKKVDDKVSDLRLLLHEAQPAVDSWWNKSGGWIGIGACTLAVVVLSLLVYGYTYGSMGETYLQKQKKTEQRTNQPSHGLTS